MTQVEFFVYSEVFIADANVKDTEIPREDIVKDANDPDEKSEAKTMNEDVGTKKEAGWWPLKNSFESVVTL